VTPDLVEKAVEGWTEGEMDKGEIIEKVDDRVKNSDNNKRVKKRVKIES